MTEKMISYKFSDDSFLNISVDIKTENRFCVFVVECNDVNEIYNNGLKNWKNNFNKEDEKKIKELIQIQIRKREFYKVLIMEYYNKYKDSIIFDIAEKTIRCNCDIQNKKIYIYKDIFDQPCFVHLSYILHEIGHCETNTQKMSRWKREYLAYEWCLNELKKHNIQVPKFTIESWNAYINNFKKQYDAYHNDLINAKDKKAFKKRYSKFKYEEYA